MGGSSLTIIALLAVGMHLIVYAFARFSYEVAEGELRAKRHILGGIPFGKWAIRLAEIRAVKRSVLSIPPWARVVGNLYSLNGVVLVTDKRGLFARRQIYVTPPNPDEFVAKVGPLVGAAATQTPMPESRPVMPLGSVLPVWLGDLIVLLSGLPVLVVLARDSYLAMVPVLLRSFGPWAGGKILAVAAIALVAVTCLWMIVDSFRELRRTAEARYVAWLLAMFLFYPSSWFYYFAEWRPRRVAVPGVPMIPGVG
jgi:hypothetical protein